MFEVVTGAFTSLLDIVNTQNVVISFDPGVKHFGLVVLFTNGTISEHQHQADKEKQEHVCMSDDIGHFALSSWALIRFSQLSDADIVESTITFLNWLDEKIHFMSFFTRAPLPHATVLIERQMANNYNCYKISWAVFSHYIEQKLRLPENCQKHFNVTFVSAREKIPKNIRQTVKTYKDRKKFGVDFCCQMFKNDSSDNGRNFFHFLNVDENVKKDDVCDPLLQAFCFISRRKSKKEKVIKK
jgi:hypothetical protein